VTTAPLPASHFTEAQRERARALVAPQQAPLASSESGDPVWPLVMADCQAMGPALVLDMVLADMWARDEMGALKYNTPLCLNNGRDHLRDLYQEELDAAVYTKAAILDPRYQRFAGKLGQLYFRKLDTLREIRLMIAAHDGEIP